MKNIRLILLLVTVPTLLPAQNLQQKIFNFWEHILNDSPANDTVWAETSAGMEEYMLLFPDSKKEDELLLDLAEIYGRLNRPVKQWNSLLKLLLLHGNSAHAPLARSLLDSINNYNTSKVLDIRHVAALNQALEKPPETDYRHAFINYLNLLVNLDIPSVNRLAVNECRLYLRLFIDDSEDTALILFWKGLFEERSGQTNRAKLSFKLLQKLFPEADVVANSYYQMALLSRDDPATARNYLVELINQFPEHPLSARAQYLFAEIYYNNGALDEALNNFRLILDAFPNSPLCPEALIKISAIYEEKENYEKARHALKQAMLYNVSDKTLKKILKQRIALEKSKSGDPATLVETRLEYVSRFYNDPEAPGQLLAAARESLENLGDREKALQLLKRLIDNYPAGKEARQAMEMEKKINNGQ